MDWRVTTPLIVGLLLVSGLAAVGTKAVMAEDEPPVETLVIGVGRTQDRVHYGGTVTQTTGAEAAQARPHARVFEVAGLGSTVARNGDQVDTLLLRERYTLDGRPNELAWTEYVDLSSRTLARFDTLQERRDANGYYEDVRSVFVRVGPSGTSEVGWQGKTLRLGSDLTSGYCLGVEAPPPGVQETFRQWVSAAGWYDGRPALAVRSEYRSHDNGRSHDHSHTSTRWFVEGHPYPVLIEELYQDLDWEPGKPETTESWTSHEVYVLSKVEEAGDAVPWRQAPEDPCAGAATREPSRSEGKVPTDRDARLWSYPPSAAIRDIQASPAFLAWTTNRATAQVVGIIGRARQDVDTLQAVADEPQAWTITFARGSEWARFDVERPRANAPALVRAPLEFTAPDPLPMMPTNPVTLGYVESVWRRLEIPCGQPAFDFFWGVSTRAAAVNATTQTFDWLGLGCRTGPGYPVPGSYLPGATHHLNVTGILMSATSGALRSMTSTYLSSSSKLPLPADEHAPGPAVVLAAGRVQSVAAAELVVWTSSTVFVLALAALLIKIVAAGVVPGYAKIRNQELLDHPVRETIYSTIQQRPGIDPPTLQRDLGLAWSTLNYHLAVLQRDRLLNARVIGRHKHLFAAGSVAAPNQEQLGVLQNERTRSIFEHIRANPGAHQRGLARTFAIDPKAVAWHLQRLAAARLIGSTMEGRKRRWRATATTRATTGTDLLVAN